MAAINTVGRRKTSVARIYLTPGSGTITVNGRTFEEYFPTMIYQQEASRPLTIANVIGQFDIKANISGGGINGQVGAFSLAVARALNEHDAELRGPLKAEGLFTRDPRMVERKKFGRRKARRRFQFSKR
jgi:small subunit ribosomal protein S9